MHDSKRRLLTWLVIRVVGIVYRRHRLLVALLRVLLRVLLRSTLLRVLLLGIALLGVTLLRVLLLLRITLLRVLLILRLHRRRGSLVTVLRLLAFRCLSGVFKFPDTLANPFKHLRNALGSEENNDNE